MKKYLYSAAALLLAATMLFGCGKQNVSDHKGGRITEPTSETPTIIPSPSMTTPSTVPSVSEHSQTTPHTENPSSTQSTMDSTDHTTESMGTSVPNKGM